MLYKHAACLEASDFWSSLTAEVPHFFLASDFVHGTKAESSSSIVLIIEKQTKALWLNAKA